MQSASLQLNSTVLGKREFCSFVLPNKSNADLSLGFQVEFEKKLLWGTELVITPCHVGIPSQKSHNDLAYLRQALQQQN